MNKQTEALKMAIEALDDIELCDYQTQQKAIQACKEALEPDRTGMVYYKNNACKAKDAKSPDCICWTPKQPTQEPVAYDKLTNDEKAQIKRQINNAFNEGFEKGKDMSLVASIPPNFIRLEPIDNPAPQPTQEPVAWRNPNDDDKRHAFMWNTDARDKQKYTVALYTHPAPSNGMDKPLFARVVPWQGLSDDEMMKTIEICEDKCGRHLIGGIMIARAIEQALKEKNHG